MRVPQAGIYIYIPNIFVALDVFIRRLFDVVKLEIPVRETRDSDPCEHVEDYSGSSAIYLHVNFHSFPCGYFFPNSQISCMRSR